MPVSSTNILCLLAENQDKVVEEDICKPIKKCPLLEARQTAYQMDQEWKFEHMSVLEEQQHNQHLEVDTDVDAFVTGIAFSLQKSSGQQREHLFADIHNLIYDTLYPHRVTAPWPRVVQGTEPNLGAFCPPCPVSTTMTPSVHGDSTAAGYSNWSHVPTYQMDGSGESSRNVPFKEL